MIRPGSNAKIAEFVTALDELIRAIDQDISLNTGIVTAHMGGEVDTICRS